MFRIPCPHCGPRDASEFRHLGEESARPDPRTTTARQWRGYLYDKRNVAGWTTETWFHRAGCRTFLTVERDTLTNEVRSAGSPGDAVRPPGVEVDAGSPDADSAPA